MHKMFRFMRPAKTFLSVSRAPIKVETRIARGEPIKVQNVRMQRRVRARSVAISAVAVYVSYMVWAKICLEPVLQALVDASPDSDSEEESEVPPLFIPLPGTTKQLDPRRYSTTDPEYQAALKLFKVEGKIAFLKEELAHLVLKSAQKNSLITTRYGSDLYISRFWLNVAFPMYAQPTYVRTGIKITDDYVALAVEPVDANVVFKLRQALWPSGMALGIWSFAKVMVTEDIKRLSRALGFQPSANVPIAELLAKQQQQQTAKLPTSRQPQLLGDSQTQKGAVLAREDSSGNKKPPGQDESSADEAKANIKKAPVQFYLAFAAFLKQLASTWKPPPRNPPPGSILTEGLIELEAPRVYLVCKARAYWDMKTNSYDTKSMSLTLVQMHAKRPGLPPPRRNLSR